MKFTRQGKIIFTTQDPVCAAQLLALEKVVNTPVSTNIIWENITSRFLLHDIPTTVSLSEVAAELSKNNEIEIVEIRRFVKQNNARESSNCSGYHAWNSLAWVYEDLVHKSKNSIFY
ncbi:hypothetical protein AVEN_99350-1 [Araneus ventricosus]|uniref:Uncharacterized protein n=1 Tax=Araneus ventricosus TaxID=182803 RepID=A0A4Y2QWF5_ARAVE|nr:hypothetical protein AVEN_99350-1 [Araneus ventricosus]